MDEEEEVDESAFAKESLPEPANSRLPAEVKWAPSSDKDEKHCLQLFGEYVKQRRSVTELALMHRCSSSTIRKKVKWAALRMRLELQDNDVVRQIQDSALFDHLDRLEKEIEGCKLPSVRAALLKERRLTLKDLAEIRGIRDFSKRKGSDGQINIIIPPINRGEGTKVVAESPQGPQEIVIENDASDKS